MIFFSASTGGVGPTNPLKGGETVNIGGTEIPQGEIPPTMDGIHDFLVKALGKEAGEKIFNNFQKSIIVMATQTTQHYIDRAKKAAKESRQHQ